MRGARYGAWWQAAIGGAALDLAISDNLGPEAEARGQLVLTLSVLVILLTAPVGAFGIGVCGPLLLDKTDAMPQEEVAVPEKPIDEAADGDEKGEGVPTVA